MFKYFVLLIILLAMNIDSQVEAADKAKNPQYEITVTQGGKELGKIVIELWPEIAPKHVANFDNLATTGFYNGTAFHRVIPGFMIQGGDPNTKNKPKETWGMGDPSQPRVPAEFNKTKHVRGIISAARSQDPNSASSQFFIMHADAPHLDGQYTAYGKVLSGMEVVDKVATTDRDRRDCPNVKVEMTMKKLNAKK